MISADIFIKDGNGNIIGTFNMQPSKVTYGGSTINYEFNFIYVTLKEEAKSYDKSDGLY